MFNTAVFVLEVQKRPCLWNVKDGSHNDRQLKTRAWEQIASILNSANDSYFLNNKSITTDELQRKWKHLRDYYTREKKRTSKSDSVESISAVKGASAMRKRKSPLLDMLQFLDVNRGCDIVEITVERDVEEENFYIETNEEQDKGISEYTFVNSRPCKIQKIEIVQSQQNLLNEDNEDNSDKQFLASLLPILNNMSTKEKFKFREQLLNPTPSQECPPPSKDEEEENRTPETRKRLRTARKSEEVEIVNVESKSTEATPRRDEFSIYGEYVANKLRNIQNTHARHTAEFHINGILYKAEMGEYDMVSRGTTQSTKSTNTMECSNTRTIDSHIYEGNSSEIITTVIKTEVLE